MDRKTDWIVGVDGERIKWPAAKISGDRITSAQVLSILSRTDRFFAEADILFDKDRDYEKRDRFLDKCGFLYLQYFSNRIIKPYDGAESGWCKEDGTIRYDGNIGKWPTKSMILEDLDMIANAFPFLSMKVLIADRQTLDGMSRKYAEFESEVDFYKDVPLLGYVVNNGKAKTVDVNDLKELAMRKPVDGLYNYNNNWGIDVKSILKLKKKMSKIWSEL